MRCTARPQPVVGAWDSIRVQTRTLSPAEAGPVITQIL
jgi:hypothetical protein